MLDDFRPTQPGTQKPQSTVRAFEAAHTPYVSALPQPEHHELLAATTDEKHARPHHYVQAWWFGLGKKQRALVIFAVIFLAAGLGGGTFYAFKPKEQPKVAAVTVTKKASAGAPVPSTVASKLTGLQVDPSVNQRPVIGVMVENSIDARPQSGLDQAGVVFEAVAEGGVTRFMALFQDSQPTYIGPVRSSRPYYLQWCQGFDCAYAHVGGSPEALQDIKDWDIKDLNQFYGASFFQRIHSRAAPHNVYTSIAQLDQFATQKGYTTSAYSGFNRLATEPTVDPASVTAKSINFDYQGKNYDVHYDYDAATNTYKRSEAGMPHNVIDANGTATQLAPKVVIGMAVSRSQGTLDSSNAYYSVYQAVGSGEAYIFQNGTVVHGTWTKASPTSQIDFLDDKGTTIKLDPGQTWITALDSIGNASFN